MEKESKAMELMKFIWDNMKADSYLRINNVLSNALELAINAQLKFEKGDFDNIFKSFRGGHWFGVNGNGKGHGESLYALACKVGNISAAQSYEAFYDFKPFVTQKGNRLRVNSNLNSRNRRFRVTGFDFETKKIYFVSYELPNWQQQKGRNLHSFDNKEWNAFRKELTEV